MLGLGRFFVPTRFWHVAAFSSLDRRWTACYDGWDKLRFNKKDRKTWRGTLGLFPVRALRRLRQSGWIGEQFEWSGFRVFWISLPQFVLFDDIYRSWINYFPYHVFSPFFQVIWRSGSDGRWKVIPVCGKMSWVPLVKSSIADLVVQKGPTRRGRQCRCDRAGG